MDLNLLSLQGFCSPGCKGGLPELPRVTQKVGEGTKEPSTITGLMELEGTLGFVTRLQVDLCPQLGFLNHVLVSSHQSRIFFPPVCTGGPSEVNCLYVLIC